MIKTGKQKWISLLLTAALFITMLPVFPARSEGNLSLNVNEPFTNTTYIEDVADTSNSYRIPAMVTLKDGTIVAAADARWNTTYDGGGLDTLVARSTDGGVSWEYTMANYLGDNGNVYNGTQSTCFIDPCLTVAADGQTVYMLCDLYPYGVALNGSKDTAPSTAVGFTDDGYLKLSNNDHYSYGYYLKDGKIYSTAGTEVSGYTVDGYFNLYYNGTQTSNLFYADSPYKVVRTGFLYLTKSTDGGATWSEPMLLDLKTTSEQVCLVGPGRGITTKNGTMVFPVYSFHGDNDPSGNTQRLSFVYSSDGINWNRTAEFNHNWASEAAVVELADGTLRFFFRNGTTNLCYVDYNLSAHSWGSAVTLSNIDTNSNTQISAISYSKTVDGKQVILVSCPTGSNRAGSNSSSGSARLNGSIFVFTVDGGTMNLETTIEVNSGNVQFMYSCLTERSDGSIAILFEDKENAWGTGSNCYYTMDMKAYAASDLGLSFDDGSGSVTPDPDPDDPDAPYQITLSVGQSKTVTVSDTETLGTAGAYTSDDGNVNYVVRHYANTSVYQKVTSGIESGKKYLLVCSSAYAVTTSSSSSNAWGVESLPLARINFDGTETAYFWTITETTGGYYLQNPAGQYMTIETGTSSNQNYKVTLSSTPFVCDIVSSGDGYMIFADGTYIGLNNAGGSAYNQTALGWTSADNTVWTLYEYVQQGGTEVEITGLGVTSGTTITVGDVVYTVVVEPLEKSENCFVINGTQITLDAVSDLGLSGADYTVTYEETQDDSGIIMLDGATVTAHESATGTAVITATVKNANGVLAGTITYNVIVSNVLVTDVENVFVAVGNTASIASLTGEVITTLLDTSIATVDQADGTILTDGTITITAVDNAENVNKTTAIVVGTTQFNIHIVPVNEENKDAAKYIYVEVEQIENCTVYYAINASQLHQVAGTGILIDETFYDGFNLMFFAVPDEGYVLTEMTSVEIKTDGTEKTLTDFYSIANGNRADGSDSDAWPFVDPDATNVPTNSNDSAWVSGHGFRWSLMEGNMTIDGMRAMFTAALELGAQGATTITKNSTDGINVKFSFVAEKLPTFTKTIVAVNGEAYDESTIIEFGDVITYQFTITTTSDNVDYTDIRILDTIIGYDSGTSIADNSIDAAGTYTFTADYTVKIEDVDKYVNGKFLNRAELTYTYTSPYDSGSYEFTSNASVFCDISGMVYYTWADNVPAQILDHADTYLLPGQTIVTYNTAFLVESYVGQTHFEVVENGVAVGKWEFSHWAYNGQQYRGGETETMVAQGSIEFVGVWEYTAYPTFTVTYQWTGAPSGVFLPTDSGAYYTGQTYFVDDTYKPGDTVTVDGITYTFSGWLMGTAAVSGQQVMGNSNVTLTGVWASAQIFTSLTISKQGHEAMDQDQTFLFRIQGEGIDLTVTVHGAGSVIIDGLKVNGTYTVTELTDWSWRYGYVSYTTALNATAVENGAKLLLADSGNVIIFTNEREETYWLDGDSWLDNLLDLPNP